MKTIVFDTGPIISLTMNNLLWILEPLQMHSGGDFFITPKVYNELIDRPLATKKYKFEALQILPFISRGIIKVLKHPTVSQRAMSLLNLANTCFKARGNWISIVHEGEMQAVSAALLLGAQAIAIDERTTRKLIEDPTEIQAYLEKKLHCPIAVNNLNLKQIQQEIAGLTVIRSTELVAMAYELGLLNKYILNEEEKIVPHLRKQVLEGALWAVKLSGCSIRRDDLEEMVKLEK